MSKGLLGRVLKRFQEPNQIIDRELEVPVFSALGSLNIKIIDFAPDVYQEFHRRCGTVEQVQDKKILEYFVTRQLLDIRPRERVLDAAGGRSGYLKVVGSYADIEAFITDHIYKTTTWDPVTQTHIVAGDIAQLALDPASVDKIACHHAIEHFQGRKDQAFLSEAWRVLAPGGSLVFAPVFLADKYVECWNIDHQGTFDDAASLLIDNTASLPGSDSDGHFARVYSPEAFRTRVLDFAEGLGFRTELFETLIGGQRVPDMKKNRGSKLNHPMRALRLTKPHSGS